MSEMTRFIRILLMGTAGGLILAILFSIASTFLSNYSRADGFLLPGGQVIGGDFLCFYVAGKTVHENKDSLYDYSFLIEEERKLLEGTEAHPPLLPFFYPPLVALMFSLFSRWSFLTAYSAWVFVSILLLVASLTMILRTTMVTNRWRWMFLVAAFAFVPFSVDCLAGGQTSCIGVFIYALVFVLLKDKRDLLAGLVLGFAYYKPPIFAVFLLFMVLDRRWRVILGFTLMSLALWSGTVMMVGWDGLWTYLSRAMTTAYGQEIIPGYYLPVKKGVSLYPFLFLLFRGSPLLAKTFYVVLAVISVATYRIIARRLHDRRDSRVFDLLFALQVSLSLLLSPYLVIHDITMILVPLALALPVPPSSLTSWENRLLACSMAALFGEFMLRTISLGPITLQTTTVVLLFWVFVLFRHLYLGQEKET